MNVYYVWIDLEKSYIRDIKAYVFCHLILGW